MYHDKDIKEVFKELNSSETGLTQKESEERLSKYGPNEIKEEKKISIYTKCLRMIFCWDTILSMIILLL